MERVGLEAVGLAMDARRGLAIRRVDEAEDFAGLFVDEIVLVVDVVRAPCTRRSASCAPATSPALAPGRSWMLR
jgi:hypothetical protein